MSNGGFRQKFLIPALGCVIVLLFVITGYRMFSFVAGRFGSNFSYPFLKLQHRSSAVDGEIPLQDMDQEQLIGKAEELNRRAARAEFELQQLRQENRTLRTRLTLVPPPETKFLTAEIILRDPQRAVQSFVIDRGSADGVARGDAVVDAMPDRTLVLVGVIDDCQARSARVMTVADPRLRLSGDVPLNDGNVVGFVNAGTALELPGLLRFGLLPRLPDYRNGVTVLTTGYERGIPAGLRIGKLVTDAAGSVDEFETAADFNCHIAPSAVLATLRTVTVVVRRENRR